MGIMDSFKKKKGGWNCSNQNEDGTRICRRWEQDTEGNKIATGTEFGISTDSETCEPVFTGDVSIVDDDDKRIEEIARKVTAKCRQKRGI